MEHRVASTVYVCNVRTDTAPGAETEPGRRRLVRRRPRDEGGTRLECAELERRTAEPEVEHATRFPRFGKNGYMAELA